MKEKNRDAEVKPRGIGRPSALTPETKEKFLAALRVGSYLQDAADYAGIGRSTAMQWMAKGRAGTKPEYVDFVEAVEGALSASITTDLAEIAKAAKAGDWRASAWRLEHRHPTKFGPQVKVVEQELSGFLERLKEKVPPDVYEQILSAAVADPG